MGVVKIHLGILRCVTVCLGAEPNNPLRLMATVGSVFKGTCSCLLCRLGQRGIIRFLVFNFRFSIKRFDLPPWIIPEFKFELGPWRCPQFVHCALYSLAVIKSVMTGGSPIAVRAPTLQACGS